MGRRLLRNMWTGSHCTLVSTECLSGFQIICSRRTHCNNNNTCVSADEGMKYSIYSESLIGWTHFLYNGISNESLSCIVLVYSGKYWLFPSLNMMLCSICMFYCGNSSLQMSDSTLLLTDRVGAFLATDEMLNKCDFLSFFHVWTVSKYSFCFVLFFKHEQEPQYQNAKY